MFAGGEGETESLGIGEARRLKMRQVLVLAVAMFVGSVAQAQNGKIITSQDFANNAPRCSKGTASFKVAVGPKLPAYQIRLVQDPVSAEIATLHHVGRIEISQGRSLLETIEINSIWSDSLCSFFAMKDVNFDGYLDIAVLRDGGGKWSRYDYYVFDRVSGRFVTNALTEDLAQVKSSGIVLDASSQQIQAPFFKGRCAGVDTYKIATGRLEKIQIQEITPSGDECRITVKQNLQGTWEVVRSSRTFDMSGPGF